VILISFPIVFWGLIRFAVRFSIKTIIIYTVLIMTDELVSIFSMIGFPLVLMAGHIIEEDDKRINSL
jgi:hypothetical protein